MRPPPDEAYSRVTRDLATVTAAYARWLDGLPGRLERSYECSVDETTKQDLRGLTHGIARAYVVRPASREAAPLVVGRGQYDGGDFAEFGLGHRASELVPDCFCDACDADADGMIEEARSAVVVVTGGFEEWHRWPAPRFGRRDPGAGQISSGYRGRSRGRATYDTHAFSAQGQASGWQPWAQPGIAPRAAEVTPPSAASQSGLPDLTTDESLELPAHPARPDSDPEPFHVTWRPWTLRT